MPLYDRLCDKCSFRRDDAYEQSSTPDYSCKCGGLMKRIPMTSNPGAMGRAQGDECDVLAKHGLCNPDGSPHRYTSKSEMRKAAEKRGLTNYVVHSGLPGSDKNPDTQKWY
jgi:hypothetical protein